MKKIIFYPHVIGPSYISPEKLTYVRGQTNSLKEKTLFGVIANKNKMFLERMKEAQKKGKPMLITITKTPNKTFINPGNH